MNEQIINIVKEINSGDMDIATMVYNTLDDGTYQIQIVVKKSDGVHCLLETQGNIGVDM